MKRVLVITYYWPPSGGAGVHRWLKFTKYLRDFGWEPVIFTPSNPEAPAIDNSLAKDVPDKLEIIRTPIWEPYNLYKKFIGQKKEDKIKTGFLTESKKPKFTESIAVWLRGNFFIPDARCFWIRPSVKYLLKYLEENPVDLIVSNGPPHSVHMIAYRLKKKTNLPWLADFRDPWTKIDFYDKLKLSWFADQAHKRMERKVLQNADRIVTVSRSWAEDFVKLSGGKQIDVITNGFDPDDFRFEKVRTPLEFSLVHIGSLNRDRNPDFLWKILGELCMQEPGFREALKIKFIGHTDFSVSESLKKYDLDQLTIHIGFLPHDEALKMASQSAVLLLLINDTPNVMGIIPGKIFEYMALQRPVLCIGPVEGDSSRIIHESGSGYTVGFNKEEELREALLKLYLQFKEGRLCIDQANISLYSRKELAGKMAGLFEEMCL